MHCIIGNYMEIKADPLCFEKKNVNLKTNHYSNKIQICMFLRNINRMMFF